MEKSTLETLKEYCAQRDDIILAFLFGSQAKGLSRPTSDWDVAVYLAPHRREELETRERYHGENEIRADISRLVSTDLDFVVLNRALYDRA